MVLQEMAELFSKIWDFKSFWWVRWYLNILICISLMPTQVEHFHVLFGHLYTFFCEVSAQMFCPLFYWVIIVIEVLYIFLMPVLYPIDVFSKSVACLFTFLFC